MKPTKEHRSTRRKSYPNSILYTKNFTRNGLRLNPRVREFLSGEKKLHDPLQNATYVLSEKGEETTLKDLGVHVTSAVYCLLGCDAT
jgi:hypothetical protein